jgi:CRISPR/Cas system-associated protein Csm6
MINVVNKHKHSSTENDIYIGRGSTLGNPYTSIKNRKTKANFICNSREESINSFEKYIEKKISEKDKKVCEELNRIWRMAKEEDVNLVCFCKPKSCHGDVIKKIIEEKL